ncbi:MAG: PTS fructose transporter subunit IIB [Clostridium sp.]|uniref:PTS fructose transporter subunit IIB n=1 Tax=Clostridium sp. TaxID=1506 RepID=UPI002A84256A|nr:PTS fructose transporter subunit IIB [Clostridium sp.]MDY5098685.1 PTS fructose transporter subunit IIB [Clostridium sp.]
MKIVGITACPTGIAHTYMAQEALEKECRRRGYDVKIETQGSIGIENELSQEEIDEADVIILAVAVMVEGEERFEDKEVFNADVNDAISKPSEVMDEAIKAAGL